MRPVIVSILLGLGAALTPSGHDALILPEASPSNDGPAQRANALPPRHFFSPLSGTAGDDGAMLLEAEASVVPEALRDRWGEPGALDQPNRRTTKPMLKTMEYQGTMANGPDCKIKTRTMVYQYRKKIGSVFGDASRFFKVTDSDCTEGGQDTVPVFSAMNPITGATVLTVDPNEVTTAAFKTPGDLTPPGAEGPLKPAPPPPPPPDNSEPVMNLHTGMVTQTTTCGTDSKLLVKLDTWLAGNTTAVDLIRKKPLDIDAQKIVLEKSVLEQQVLINQEIAVPFSDANMVFLQNELVVRKNKLLAKTSERPEAVKEITRLDKLVMDLTTKQTVLQQKVTSCLEKDDNTYPRQLWDIDSRPIFRVLKEPKIVFIASFNMELKSPLINRYVNPKTGQRYYRAKVKDPKLVEPMKPLKPGFEEDAVGVFSAWHQPIPGTVPVWEHVNEKGFHSLSLTKPSGEVNGTAGTIKPVFFTVADNSAEKGIGYVSDSALCATTSDGGVHDGFVSMGMAFWASTEPFPNSVGIHETFSPSTLDFKYSDELVISPNSVAVHTWYNIDRDHHLLTFQDEMGLRSTWKEGYQGRGKFMGFPTFWAYKIQEPGTEPIWHWENADGIHFYGGDWEMKREESERTGENKEIAGALGPLGHPLIAQGGVYKPTFVRKEIAFYAFKHAGPDRYGVYRYQNPDTSDLIFMSKDSGGPPGFKRDLTTSGASFYSCGAYLGMPFYVYPGTAKHAWSTIGYPERDNFPPAPLTCIRPIEAPPVYHWESLSASAPRHVYSTNSNEPLVEVTSRLNLLANNGIAWFGLPPLENQIGPNITAKPGKQDGPVVDKPPQCEDKEKVLVPGAGADKVCPQKQYPDRFELAVPPNDGKPVPKTVIKSTPLSLLKLKAGQTMPLPPAK